MLETPSLHPSEEAVCTCLFWDNSIFLRRCTRGVGQEEHPSDNAAAAARRALAAFSAGRVTTLSASALGVNSEARKWAKRQHIPREADVIASLPVPETVLET